jgi:hypothetical protein
MVESRRCAQELVGYRCSPDCAGDNAGNAGGRIWNDATNKSVFCSFPKRYSSRYSLVEIDIMQNAVQMSGWTSARERPIYLIWRNNGHSCCWCPVQGGELTLLPYPLSHQPVRHLNSPREASVIGRVTNSWFPSEQQFGGRGGKGALGHKRLNARKPARLQCRSMPARPRSS